MNQPLIHMNHNLSTISYSNDAEYRATIRTIFSMSTAKSLLSVVDDVDPVSLDENLYDTAAATKTLDRIYAETRSNPVFRRIYKHAAGFMFSEDEEIGLAVLFSYDYLGVFYPCLNEKSIKDSDSPVSPVFQALYKKLGLESV